LHAELEADGLTVVTVALDIEPSVAWPWIDAAAPTHPSLIDSSMVTTELLGFANVPMAVAIDEDGVLVRPAEVAVIERSPIRDGEIPDGLPERLKDMLVEVRKLPGDPDAYRAGIVDWVANGAKSDFALTPDEVIAGSAPRGADRAKAVACFELGQDLYRTIGHDAAVPWWREAHRLDPSNWSYKRQAWSLVTTQPGQPPDLIQGPNDVYEGNWLDDVRELGAEHYYPEPDR
jgi:hypothetical protein